MKILFHLNSLGHGGAERVVSILSGELVSQGHEVVIATEWYSDKEYALDPKVKRINVGLREDDPSLRPIKVIRRYTNVRKCIRKELPHVVISFCNKANFRCSVGMLGIKIPLIVSVRNDPNTDYAPYRLSTRLMERRANGCVFQTAQALAYFDKALGERSVIIPNPLSEQYCRETAFHYQAESFKDDLPVISIGRIAPQKNQKLLIEAFCQVAKEFPQACLNIYGNYEDEAYLNELKGMISEYDLEQKVNLCGVSTHVIDELKKSYMFVLSSDYEGMPNALMEAMSLGLPCISTDCPCGGPHMLLKEMQPDSESGVLVPVGDVNALSDAMLSLLKDRAYAQELGNAARFIKEKADPANICRQWIDYIEEVVG